MAMPTHLLPKINARQRRYRLAIRHRLIASQFTDEIANIADSLVALHASDPATVYLSAAVRMRRPSVLAVAQAFTQHRSVIRHHAMRRTIWAMTPRVAQLAHGAATAKIAVAERRRTLQALAQSGQIREPEVWLQQATQRIQELLSRNQAMSARKIGQALPELVVPLEFGSEKNSTRLNAHTKVLQGGGFDGTFIRTEATGGWVSGEYLWAETGDWLGRELAVLTEREAAPSLLYHWLSRFGPATLGDIRWWFGWPARTAERTLKQLGAECVHLDGTDPGWVLAGDHEDLEEPEPWVRLLPGLDPTVMGWRERTWYLNPKWVPQLFDQFGNAGPTIWADGRVVGGWIQRPDGSLAVELFTRLERRHQRLLDEAVEQIRQFAGQTIVKPRFPAPLQKKLLAAGT
jgi:hypothetical protein